MYVPPHKRQSQGNCEKKEFEGWSSNRGEGQGGFRRGANASRASRNEWDTRGNSGYSRGAGYSEVRFSGREQFGSRARDPWSKKNVEFDSMNDQQSLSRKENDNAKPTQGSYDSKECAAIEKFYSDNSKVFRSWMDCRNRASENKYIAKFFERKDEGRNTNNKRHGAYTGADIRPIFTQFFKYAVDIDNGLAFSKRANDVAVSQGKCWFLDFGFAPGGMADLLLNTHEGVYGVGVSLEPEKGGNVHLEALDSNERFWTLFGDVISLAREDCDIKTACNLPNDFDGFDMVIVGITIHQAWEGEDMNELKDLLLFAQLYFALKYCKPGGMIMIRMHMSIRLIDCHVLALMLSLFDIKKFSGLTAGLKFIELAKRKPNCSTETNANGWLENETEKPYAWRALEKTAVAAKPFSTFSMRKSYWVIFHGFDCEDENREKIMLRLQELLKDGVFAYGYNDKIKGFNLPILVDEDIDTIMEKSGVKIIELLEDVWAKQVVALEGFMHGLTDKYCRRGRDCRRYACLQAHDDSQMIPDVVAALKAVDRRANSRLSQAFGDQYY